MPRLTQKLIDSLRPDGRDRIVFDDTVPGFGVRVFRSGRKSYLIQYRSQKRTRRYTLGNCNVLTPQQARKRAASLLAGVLDGSDPAQIRRDGFAAPTVADLVERFLRDHSAKKKTGAEDRRNLEKDLLPVLGRHLAEAVTCSDIDRLHAAIGERAPVTANRVVAAASTMFGLAERWGMRPEGTNPCRRVKRFRERPRERYLSELEQARLGTVMREFEAERGTGWEMVVPLRILILTGARHGEIQQLRWDEVDFDAGLFRLADSKTGPKTIQVSPIVMDLIAGLERRSDFLFPVIDGSKPVAQSVIHRAWAQIRTRAGLEDVRVHDLRHTFASAGVNSGLSLPIIAKILGHSRLLTTERYSHLSADPVRAGADRIAQKISAALDGKPPAQVVPLRGA